MDQPEYLCRLPLTELPLLEDADYGYAHKPIIHVNRTAPFHVAIYLLQGHMEIIEEGVTYELTPHTLFFLKSHVRHWGSRPYALDSRWLYAHFRCDDPADDAKPFECPVPPFSFGKELQERYRHFVPIPKLLRLPRDNFLLPAMEKVVKAFQSGNLPDANASFLGLLLHCREYEPRQQPEKPSVKRVRSMISFLEKSMGEPFSQQSMEKHFRLTYKHLGAIFKAGTGSTIHAYLISLRLHKASRLLTETSMPISQVAAECGFQDPLYFSRSFRRAKGLSPRDYRNQYVPKI